MLSCKALPLYWGEHITGWWFQTFFIFHNIWDNPSHWLSYFSRWLKPPTRSSAFSSKKSCFFFNNRLGGQGATPMEISPPNHLWIPKIFCPSSPKSPWIPTKSCPWRLMVILVMKGRKKSVLEQPLSVLLPDHDDGHPCALHASSLHLREEFALARCKCQRTPGDAHAGRYGESGGLDVFASYTLGWYLIFLLSVKFSWSCSPKHVFFFPPSFFIQSTFQKDKDEWSQPHQHISSLRNKRSVASWGIFQVAGYSVLLWWYLGVAGFAGIVVLLIGLPFNARLQRDLSGLNKTLGGGINQMEHGPRNY